MIGQSPRSHATYRRPSLGGFSCKMDDCHVCKSNTVINGTNKECERLTYVRMRYVEAVRGGRQQSNDGQKHKYSVVWPRHLLQHTHTVDRPSSQTGIQAARSLRTMYCRPRTSRGRFTNDFVRTTDCGRSQQALATASTGTDECPYVATARFVDTGGGDQFSLCTAAAAALAVRAFLVPDRLKPSSVLWQLHNKKAVLL